MNSEENVYHSSELTLPYNYNYTPEQHFYDPKHKRLVHKALRTLGSDPYALAKKHGMEYEDFVQYGNETFWKACHSYSSTHKYKFSTYAIKAVRWRIMDLINSGCGIITYTKKVSEEERIGLSSLDEPYEGKDGGETSLHDVIPDNNTYVVDSLIEDLKHNDYIKGLNETQKKVVNLKIDKYLDTEIADILGLTRQRIGQIVKEIRFMLKGEIAV